jgi:hypothetical protein
MGAKMFETPLRLLTTFVLVSFTALLIVWIIKLAIL